MNTDIHSKLVYHIGTVYRLLALANGAFDGESDVQYTDSDGNTRVIHVHIDGDDVQFYTEPGSVGLSGRVTVESGK